MDIEELLRTKPLPGGVLLRGAPEAAGRDDYLVRQVMALANADLTGDRALVFGAEQGAAGAVSVTGLDAADRQRLHAQHLACLAAIEPALSIELLEAQIAGKLVAALVLGSCCNPPYVASEKAPAPLRTGECWLFDSQGLRPAVRTDLDDMYATRRQYQQKVVLVGIGEDPRCELLEVTVPDASNPPSQAAARKLRAAVAARKTAEAVMGREDTGMARLAHARIFGADSPYRQQGLDTLVRALQSVPDDYREADLHYRFERQAVQLNLSILNQGAEPLRGTALEITLPAVAGLTVATRLHPPPGDQNADRPWYPEVRRAADSYRVRASLGKLHPGCTTRAFSTALRIAVDRNLIGQKMAIRYALVAEGLKSPWRGRLRVKFRD